MRKLYKFYKRYIINKLPDYFTINFNIQQQQSSHQYNTRHHRFMIPRVHITNLLNILYAIGFLYLNVECILDKVLTHSEYGFSHYIKKVPACQYVERCNIPNCYICQTTNECKKKIIKKR